MLHFGCGLNCLSFTVDGIERARSVLGSGTSLTVNLILSLFDLSVDKEVDSKGRLERETQALMLILSIINKQRRKNLRPNKLGWALSSAFECTFRRGQRNAAPKIMIRS